VLDSFVRLSQKFCGALELDFFFGVHVLVRVTLLLNLSKSSLQRLYVNIVSLNIFQEISVLRLFSLQFFLNLLDFAPSSFAVTFQKLDRFFVLPSLPFSVSNYLF